MSTFNRFLLGSLFVVATTACRTTGSNRGPAALASASDSSPEALDAFSESLFYKYKLPILKTVIKHAPDFDSQIVLTVDLNDTANASRVKTVLNGASGYEQTIALDLMSGVIQRINTQAGAERALSIKPPRIQSDTRTQYVEALRQLLEQISAIREGRNQKNSQHLELNDLVSYLEKVSKEVESDQLKSEFTGPDAAKLMATLARLGFSPARDAQGYLVVELSSVRCTRGDGSSRLDPTSGFLCELASDSATRSAEAESEGIYRIIIKNSANDRTHEAKSTLQLRSLKCVDYQVSHGTTKCFVEQ